MLDIYWDIYTANLYSISKRSNSDIVNQHTDQSRFLHHLSLQNGDLAINAQLQQIFFCVGFYTCNSMTPAKYIFGKEVPSFAAALAPAHITQQICITIATITRVRPVWAALAVFLHGGQRARSYAALFDDSSLPPLHAGVEWPFVRETREQRGRNALRKRFAAVLDRKLWKAGHQSVRQANSQWIWHDLPRMYFII